MKADIMKGIKFMCAECMGYEFIEIKDCTAPSCPLYPFRGGRDPSPHERMKNYSQDLRSWCQMRKSQDREDWSGITDKQLNNSQRILVKQVNNKEDFSTLDVN